MFDRNYEFDVNNYCEEITDKIIEYLESRSCDFSFDYEAGIFEFYQELMNQAKFFKCIVEVYSHDYIIYGVLPFKPNVEDSDLMKRLAEFICRLNENIGMGTLLLSMDSGDIRYKNFVDCSDIIPSEQMIYNSFYVPNTILESFAGGIAAIVNGATIQEAEAILKIDRERQNFVEEGGDPVKLNSILEDMEKMSTEELMDAIFEPDDDSKE